MLISGMYFMIDYYSEITEIKGVAAPVRVLDVWIVISLQYAWLNLLKKLVFKEDKKPIYLFMNITYIGFLICSGLIYGFAMDRRYFVSDERIRFATAIEEVLTAVVIIAISIYFLYHMLKQREKKDFAEVRSFCVAGTIVMIAEAIQECYIGLRLSLGFTVLQEYNPDNMNITPILRGIMAVLILLYVAKHCMLTQYQKRPEDVMRNGKILDTDSIIERMAVDKALTERESIIVKLLYEGSSYRDIAEYLYISVNTVKHHITSLYRKLGVSSKMEMRGMIREAQQKELNKSDNQP